MSRRCQPTNSFRQFVIWMTEFEGRHEHCVTMDTAAGSRTGTYESICGVRFIAAPMTAPPGPRCVACQAHYEQRGTVREPNRPLRRLIPPALRRSTTP